MGVRVTIPQIYLIVLFLMVLAEPDKKRKHEIYIVTVNRSNL